MPVVSGSRRSLLLPLGAIALSSACLAPLAAGCAVTTDEGTGTESGAVSITSSAQSSYVSDAVLGVLGQSPATKGITWNVSHDNTFDADWLVNSPLQPLWGQPVSTLTYPKACTANCEPDFA
ncbi:MAG TPA: hypothetical protein VGI39_43625, partial [Polyangiaceae bacterium]